MLLYVLSMLVGLGLLVWGADRMVVGAAVTANNMGVSPMLVGLTVVGFATSAPEMLVSGAAALHGAPNLAVGNALGSNIANIGLVLATAAILQPLVVHSQTLRRELPVMLAVSVLPVLLFPDQTLGRLDGIFLLLVFIGFLYWIIQLGIRTHGHDPIESEYSEDLPSGVTPGKAWLWIFVGLAVLVLGSEFLVSGAKNFAQALGISELVVGVTVLAVGTSLPELAVSVVSVRKGHHGLALGNIIGSNAFNTLAVLGVAATIQPVKLDPDTVRLHLPAMLAFTVAFFFIAYNYNGTMRVSRLSGVLLLIGFITYHSYVAYQTY
jgi:cation:H+ antiporter